MIMAGRGRRLADSGDELRKVGEPPQKSTDSDSITTDVPTLTKKISEIDPSAINQALLMDIEKMIKTLFTSKEIMKDVISNFHNKSLNDVEFGEKLVVALQQVLHFEVDGALIRNELLDLIQHDFNSRENTSKTEPKKFVNSVMLLGNVFNRIKVCSKPITILALALFEYFDILLKGGDEELKTIVKQILINGTKLVEENNYKQFMQNLRNALINQNLNNSSKCWILLAIEYSSNSFQKLNEQIKDFYVTNLGEEYTKLESLIPVANDQIPHSPVSPSSQQSGSQKLKKFNSSPKESNKKDLSKKFSDMNIKPGSGKKVQPPLGRNQKKDVWKSGGDMRKNSGHDDRFEKEENFYGVQRPRQPKPDYQKKKFSNDKNNQKEFGHFKTGTYKNSEDPFQPVEGEYWDKEDPFQPVEGEYWDKEDPFQPVEGEYWE